MPFIIQNTEMEGQVNVFIWICILAGFILAFPYILWEIWKFISPALYTNEKKNAKVFIFFSSLLFFLGVIFGYFVVIPMSVNFVATFTVSDIVKNQFTLDSYIGMVKTSVLASGLFFELPIIIYFLTKLGLVSPTFLRTYRQIRYCTSTYHCSYRYTTGCGESNHSCDTHVINLRSKYLDFSICT